MFKRLIIGLLIIVVTLSHTQTLVLVNSSHTHDSFQLSLSLASNTNLYLYSKKIVKTADNWIGIDTHTNPATFIPQISNELLLINTIQEGRNIIQYYQKTPSIDLNRHFHYIGIRHNSNIIGYLLPSFSQKVPGFRTDHIYRCSQSIISIQWINGDAQIVVFSQQNKWRIAENIDNGFRSDERGIYYGYVVDLKHTHPVRVYVGDHQYCQISQDTPTAQIEFNFQVRQNYELVDLLNLVGPSLPLNNDQDRAQQL